MKLLPTLAALVVAALTAHADVVIEQKMESAMLNGNMTMKIKGDQARIDMPSPAGQVTVIMNTKTGDMTTLMHAQKIAMQMNLNAVKQQTEAAQKAAGIDPSKFEKPKATGATEKVGEWTADVYEFNAGTTAVKMWAAKDFPNAQILKDELKKVSAANAGSFDPAKMDVPGMIVKSQMTTPAGPITSTLVKATQEPVADSEFTTPAGYTAMKMPTAPGAAPQ
jgi:hypothetical protein